MDIALEAITVTEEIPTFVRNIAIDSTYIEDQGDIFHCGRCNLSFNSFFAFLSHKKEHRDNNILLKSPKFEEINSINLQEQENQIWVWNPGSTVVNKIDNYPISNNLEEITTEIIDFNTSDNFISDIDVNIDPPIECLSVEPYKDDPIKFDKNLLTCTVCDRQFKKSFNFFLHLRSHAGDKPFQCIICARIFPQKSNVSKHILSHRVWPDGLSKTLPDNAVGRNAGFQCSYCNTILADYCKLKVHLREHGHKKVYKCIQGKCNEMFTDLELLITHINSDHDKVEYHCHLCPEVCTSLEDMSMHQKSHVSSKTESKKEKKFTCVYCTAAFKRRDHLTHHLATANHVNPCSHCEKSFANERSLRRHLSIHDEIKAFKCDFCDASFRKKHYLRSHLLTHTKEKSFICTVCNAKFGRKDLLMRHVKIHLPNKKKQCPFREHSGCTMEFTRTDKLNLHIRSHMKKLEGKKYPKGKPKTAEEDPSMEIMIAPLSNGANNSNGTEEITVNS